MEERPSETGIDGLANSQQAARLLLEQIHESITQGLDDTCSDMMSDLLVIWRGARTVFIPKCLKYANDAKLLFKGKDRSKRQNNNNFKKVSAAVKRIPGLSDIVDDVRATIDGTIKSMHQNEEIAQA